MRLDVDDFERHEVLGVGTVGTIYRVTHRVDGQEFALKLLSEAVSHNPLVVSRFKREMMILSKLQHPHIVGYFGSGLHEGKLFYVMELVRGGTLKQTLAETGPFTWPEAAEIGRQIASALQHAHNHGIIHRDLKPGNIFLTRKGKTKLGDFGIARDLQSDDLTDAGLTVGTYAYMAPEIIRGERAITGNVDLYALGCLLFELITGHTPFEGDNYQQIFDQHLHSLPPELSTDVADCPRELVELVRLLLEKDPHDRPFNARTVQGILSELNDNYISTNSTRPAEDPSRRPNDRAASAVKPIQASLSRRVEQALVSKDVSWSALGWLIAGIAILIVIVLLIDRIE